MTQTLADLRAALGAPIAWDGVIRAVARQDMPAAQTAIDAYIDERARTIAQMLVTPGAPRCLRCWRATDTTDGGECPRCAEQSRADLQARLDREAARKTPREDEPPTPEDCGVRGAL